MTTNLYRNTPACKLENYGFLLVCRVDHSVDRLHSAWKHTVTVATRTTSYIKENSRRISGQEITADFFQLLTLCCHMGTAIMHPVPDRVKPSFVILTSGHSDAQSWASECPGTLTLSPERQSARMSKITNDGLTWSGTGCFIAVPIWQQWASKG